MIENIYALIALQLLPGILLGMSICFFFLNAPANHTLKNYRFSKRVLGLAYLVYAFVIMTEYMTVPFTPANKNIISQTIVLIVCYLQAFLFTYTLITLLDYKFLTLKKIRKEALPITLFIIGAFTVYPTCSDPYCRIFFYLFMAFYVGLLVRYVVMFRRYYRTFISKMDNFYSDRDSWVSRRVSFWFYAALAIGIMGLAYSIFLTMWTSLFFLTIVAIFYLCFGVHFLNYPQNFLAIEEAIVMRETDVEQEEVIPNDKDKMLMNRIESLMKSEELYKKADLSINDMASRLNINPKAISRTINRCRKENFKTYISEWRVNEAKKMILNNDLKNLTMEAIGFNAGFSGKSNFYAVFKKVTGLSPSSYRNRG